jgi:C4-dicarboxylate-specific signal transduction histidine kinase
MNDKCWDRTMQGDDIGSLRAELKEQCQLADIGELAGQVTHKFNNFLNSLLLKIALLEAELPEPAVAKFADVKQQAKSMAEVIKQVHQFQRRPSIQPVDLNPLVKQAADCIGQDTTLEPGTRSSIQVDLSSQPAQVLGSRVDLQRLLNFLLRNRLMVAAPPDRTVRLRTKVVDQVHFCLEDSAPNMPLSALGNLFDGDVKNQEGGQRLELTACKAIVRRNQGRIRAQALEGGGLLIEATFPLAQNNTPK